MPLANHFTVADLRALPDDGKRYETIHGELFVTPAPRGPHQPLVTRLMAALIPYLGANRLDQLLTSPADIIFNDDTLVQPDVLVADTAAFLRSGDWLDVRTLHLVIEIISPSSAKTDRTTKRRLYQEQRIPAYWIVDAELRQIEIWTPDATFPNVERERLVWRHPELEVDCVVDVRKLFAMGPE